MCQDEYIRALFKALRNTITELKDETIDKASVAELYIWLKGYMGSSDALLDLITSKIGMDFESSELK